MDPRLVIGRAMAAIASDPRFLRRLPGCDFLTGGCLVYAAAVDAYADQRGTPAYVVTETGAEPILQHVVLIVDDICYDGSGALPRADFLARMRAAAAERGEIDHLVTEIDQDLARQLAEFHLDDGLVDDLAAAFHAELGAWPR
jgi:hypothetical protein